jgi:HEAT repeat protein
MAAFHVREALSWGTESDSNALALLDQLVDDPSARVRGAAASALGSHAMRGARVGPRLVALLEDSDPGVRVAAADEFFYVHDSASRAAGALVLARLLDDTTQEVRRAAVYMLGNMGDVAAPGIPGIVERMRFDPDTEVRWLSARVLGWLGPQASGAVPALLAHLADTLPTVRLEALGSLGGIGISRLPPARGDSVIAAIGARLASDDTLTRRTAVQALGSIGTRAIPSLAGALHSSDSAVATIAAISLGRMLEETSIVAPLDSALGDRRRTVRDAAADALGGVGEGALPLLRARTSSGDSLERQAARRALNVYAASASLPVPGSCYSASYGPWNPPLKSESMEGVVPPKEMRFSSVRSWFARDTSAYAFLLERRYRGEWYPTGYWIPDSTSRQIEVNPLPNLSGVLLTLTVARADDVHGTIRTYWDFPAETQEASVTLTKIDCAPPTEGS